MTNITSEWPLLVILLMTHDRTDYALRAIQGVKRDMKYPNLQWYVADDGSIEEDFTTICGEISENSVLFGSHNDHSLSPGQSWNKGIRAIFNTTDYYFRLEDDWSPSREIDLRPWLKILTFREDIGMVRLGYQHTTVDEPAVRMEAIGIDGIHYYRYHKSSPFAYGGHPAIIHRRMHDAYGYFHEERNPGEIEIDFDYRVRHTEGPDIVRPASITGWGVFNHYGERKAY